MTGARIVLVAAVAENGVIGRDGGLPWRLSGDLKHFKRITMGKPVIMGRTTYAELGKALPGRLNIVVTRNPSFQADDVRIAHSFEAALSIAQEDAAANNVDEIAIIGGAQVYAELLPRAERIYLTEVHASPPGDAIFPAFDRGEWREIAREGPHRQSGETYPYSFVTLERR